MTGVGKCAVGTDTGPLLQLSARTQSELAQSAADMKLHGIERKITQRGDRRI